MLNHEWQTLKEAEITRSEAERLVELGQAEKFVQRWNDPQLTNEGIKLTLKRSRAMYRLTEDDVICVRL